MAAPAGQPRQFTGWHMLTLMIAFFSVVIGVNATLAVMASKTWSGLIVSNGYDASQHFNKEEARLKEQALLGWAATVVPTMDSITVTMLNASGQPLTGLQVAGVLKRVVTESQDKPLAFAETSPGVYRISTPVAAGKWNIELAARDFQGHSFLQTYHILVEPAAP